MKALVARYPRLARTVPRVDLRVRETPIEEWRIGALALLAKRDDLSAPLLGGNKVRALELLLAGRGPDDTLLTVGSVGSTHALAVARYGARLGSVTEVITWPQPMHDVARGTAAEMRRYARVTEARSPVDAYARAALRRVTGGRYWIPAGGSAPLGVLGHASAAVEMADQLARDGRPVPHTIVVPLGTGGTAAGLLLGLAVAGLDARVLAVRVVPAAVGNRWRVLRLAEDARRLLIAKSSEAVPPINGLALEVERASYGGAYARETSAGREAAALLAAAGGPALEGTYSAKALGAALARGASATEERLLFWLTFDGRWLAATDGPGAASPHPHTRP